MVTTNGLTSLGAALLLQSTVVNNLTNSQYGSVIIYGKLSGFLKGAYC
jgi:hypothetical protein